MPPLEVDFGDEAPPARPTARERVHPADEEYVPPAPPPRAEARPAIGRTLPHSIEAEEYLLSCLLIDCGEVLPRARSAGLTADSFHDTRHRAAYRAICSLHDSGEPVDTATLAQELIGRREFERVGGLPFITQISKQEATTAQAGFWIDRIREQALLRDAITAATGIIEDAYAGDVNGFLARQQARIRILADGMAPRTPDLTAHPLTRFEVLPRDDASILIGNRYLSRGDGAILSSRSGMGKSSLSIQAAVTWALGRPLFGGLDPHGRALRSLIFQSEDSDGDVGEVKHSLFHAMKLTDSERAQVGERVKIVTDRIHRGPSFHQELKRQIDLHSPDLVWINPLLAFIGGDINDAEAAGNFLREGLNKLNEPARFAYIVVHHNAKPPKEQQQRKWSEMMYDMAGSADLTNWARAIISLRPMEKDGQFNLVLAKRGRRAGYVVRKKGESGVPYDEVTTTIGIRHSTERMLVAGQDLPVIHWEACEAGEEDPKPNAGGRPSKYHIEDFMAVFPHPTAPAQTAAAIHNAVRTFSGISASSFKDLCERARKDGQIERLPMPQGGFGFRQLDHPNTGKE